MRKILVSITTTNNSDWKEKIREINELKLKEVALFPTCLDRKQREKLYQLLEKSEVKNIPLLHLRHDMELKEIKYFVKKYNTKAFTLHTQSEFPLIYDYSKYNRFIFIENIYRPLNPEEIKQFGGICLDMSHLENDRILEKEKFKHNIKMLEKYPIGCNHISCVKNFSHKDIKGDLRYDFHILENLSELDYLKKYPKNYFSSIIAIELENSIKEQLKIRDYITKLLSPEKI